MWYLKVSSSLYIAVALICMIQNAISLTIDQTTEDQWSKLASSTDQIDLKKISKLCKNSINSFNEKLETTKTNVNKKLTEPNKTTEDIEKLVSDVKTQIKNSSADLVTVRKLVQKTALRFRDTFKSLASFTELDNESVNRELEGIKKTTVDSKKPLVNRVVRSFGNRYDLNKLANRVLEISADREKLKNNYDEKKKIAKKELNSLWKSLTNHSKTVNDNALKAFETFFEGMKSLKSVKKKVKTIGEDAINEIKEGDDFNNLKNAVELAKALKLKFEDEWNLDSGELTYSEEQKKDTIQTMDENPVEDNEYDNSTNDIETSLPTTEQETIDNEKINTIPSTQFEIEKPSKDDSLTSDKAVSEVEETQLPTKSEDKVQTTKLQPTIKDDLPDDNISDNVNSPIEETSIIPNTENKENKEKTIMAEPKDSNNETNPTDFMKSDLSNNETTFNPDITIDETLISPNKNAKNNKTNKIINKRTSREKIPILPWKKLIQLDDPQVSQQSKKCESLLNNTTPDFDNIKKSAKNSIQVTKNYETLQKIENETVQRFYDKMVDTNTKLSDYLVNSAEDVCAKVTPINKRYETKFKNDPNIKRIKYLLGKQYDPNQYILKVLDDASHKTGIGGMKKTTYYKMLAVAHNLNHETKEMEDAALYAMNKIYEGKLAATNLQKMFNKEKASKACYIRNILQEKENDTEKKNKDENKEKVKESLNNDTNTEPLKPDVNLDSVDDIQPSTINDDNEPTLNNEEEKKTLKDKNESTTHNNLGDNENDNTTDEKENTKKENEEQKTEENYNISSIPQNRDSDSTIQTTNDGANKPKRNITRKVTHHRKHRDPNDPNDVSEEYDTIEEIDDEEDVTNEYKSSENKSNIRPEAESLVNSDNIQEVAEPEQSENENDEQKTEENYNISSIPQNKDSDSTIQTTNDGANKPKRNITRKVTHHRKHRDPNDPNDVSEEYDTIEEIDDEEDVTNEYKSSENKSNIRPEAESIFNSDNKQEVEEPEQTEKENGESNEENSTSADISEGDNSGEPKTKRRRKRIDPKDGKEISEEYDEEDGNKLNQPNEKTFDDTEKSEAPVIADNQDKVEAHEHVDSENVESNEENSTSADISEGDNSDEHKRKHRRKRIDPKDGKEISEEYDKEEDRNKLNQPNEKTFGDTDKSEAPVIADNQDKVEAHEHVDSENVESNEENSTSADISERDNSDEHKRKHRKKRIDPKDGKEISEEYDEEDGNKLNQPNEKTFDDTEKSEAPVIADNQDKVEAHEHVDSENVESNEENSTSADISEGDNSDEHKRKHRRKRIDPKDGKEISEEYDEEEEKNKLNQPNEKTFGDTDKSEAPVIADNQDKVEAHEHVDSENVESNEENSTSADISERDNSDEHKRKHRKKRIDPKDGKEISEEYDEEDGNKLNQPNEKTFDDTEKSEAPVIADNQDKVEAHEHVDSENVESNEENSTSADISEGDNSDEHKRKHRRKRIDPKDGKEISEEYDEEEEKNKLNQPNEKTFGDTDKSEAPVIADNQDKVEAHEHVDSENVESNEENSTSADISEGDNSDEHKRKHRRKRIDPKDGKEISEEYDKEEDRNKLNQPNEKTFTDTEKSESPITLDKQEGAVGPEHLQNENVESNEEINTSADIFEGDNSGESKIKRRRKRIDPKDGKEYSEENDTFEEDDNNLNKSKEKKTADTSEKEPPVHKENSTEQDTEEENTNTDIKPVNEDMTKKNLSKASKSFDENDKKIDPENTTNETEDLDENENLNSVEEAELKSVNNENIIQAAESMGEDSTSYESSYESPEQSQIDTSKKRPDNRRKDPKSGREVSEEYDTPEAPEEESTFQKNNIDTPEYDENSKDSQSYKHEPETPTNEVADEPSEVDEQPGGDSQPSIKNRRQRRPKKPRNGLEKPEDYETDKQNNESPTGDSENDRPSAPREYTEDEQSSEIPEHDENPEYNESNEHEPETPYNELADKPSEKVEQPEGDNQLNRRHRRRRDPKTGLEVSEEYDSLEEQDEKPSLEDNKIDTSEFVESPQYNESNEHEPETRTNEVADEPSEFDEQPGGNSQPSIKNRRQRRPKKPRNGLEKPEDYETDKQNNESPTGDSENDTPSEPREYTEDEQSSEIPEHDENPEYNESNEHEPETPNNELADKPSEKVEQPEGDNQPNRRHRRRRDPKTGIEVSEEYDTLEEQDDESPLEDNKIDTPEFEERPQYNESNEHEPKTPTNEVADEPSEVDEQPGGVSQPSIKNRRQRRPKKPRNGLEKPEDYETDKQNNESPTGDSENDTPSEPREYTEDEQSSEIPEHDENPEYNESNEHEPETPYNELADKPSEKVEQPEGDNQPNRRHRRRRDPKTGIEVSEEYDTLEEQDDESPLEDNKIDTPEYDEYPEYNESNEHEPETPTNEVADKPSEVDEQPEGVSQPSIKNRRQRRPKKSRNGLEKPEDYETDKQNNESPTGDSENDTPSEPREYTEDEQSSEIPEHDENPEYNESNEHEHETPNNELADKPSEKVEQPEGVNQPNRRHRRRRDPKTGIEVSEEYDTLEEQDEESPLEDNKIDTPEFEESPQYNESIEHEPETSNNEFADKPSEIDEQPERVNQPNSRHRRRRDPQTGLEVSEEYDSLEEHDEKPSLEDNKIDTPEYDEYPEYNESNEHEPETPTNEVADKPSEVDEQPEGVSQPSIKNRRQRRPKKPRNGLEKPEDYETDKQNNESPTGDSENDTPSEPREYTEVEQSSEIPEHDENPEYNESNEHEHETPNNELADKPSEKVEQPEGVNQPNRRHRRRRDPKTGIEVSEEYDTLEEQDEESPLEDNKIDTPEFEESAQYNESNEHEPKTPTNEVADEPSEVDEQPGGVSQPSIKNRRQRRPKKPRNGLEKPEDYETDKQNNESPTGDSENDTPSEPREYTEVEQSSEIPEHDENPEYNESNEHEPETPYNELADKPSEKVEQPERVNQPNRRHRRQRDPKTGIEVSEEYDTLEEQDEESPLEDNKIDTPEFEESAQYNESNEHEPETPNNEVADKPSEVDEQPEGVSQPSIKNRRQRRPKKSRNGLEKPEDYETDKQNNESPTGDSENDTPSEPREYTEDEQSSEIPEHDENPEYNESNEHEHETPNNELADKPSEKVEQPEGVNQPNRRHRRRRDPKTGIEVSEEYDTLEEQDEESPLEDNKIDTPEFEESPQYNESIEHEPETSNNEFADKPSEIDEQPERVNQPNSRHRRRRDPQTGLEVSEEYDSLEEHDEKPSLEDNKIDTPEYDEYPEYNESNEHEPETPTNEVADKPSEVDEQPEGVSQPSIKNRRQRRPKKPRNGLEKPEDYETDKQNNESPTGDSENDTPSEPREYTEVEQSSEIPEHDENPEYNESNEHEHETPNNELADKPSEKVEQPEGVNQPNRRHRRRRDPKTGIEVSEEYDTLEEQDEESPLEDNKIDTPEFEESAQYNESNEHEPETPNNEVADKPSEIDEQPESVNQPNSRHRRRRDPQTGLEVSEEYDSLEEQDEKPSLEDNKIDTPEYDEYPEYNESNEHEPETPTNEVADKPSEVDEQPEGVSQPSIKNRRQRRPKKPRNGLEKPEDYETDKQNNESPTGDSENDTPSEPREYTEVEQSSEIPEHDENPEYNESNEHEPETPYNELADKPSEKVEQPEGDNQPNRRHRRRRDPKTGIEVSEEYDTLEEQDEESPLEDNKIDTPEFEESAQYNESNEHEPETPNNEVADKPSEIDEQPERVNQPNRRHRRRRDPKTGIEVSEEYDTLEEQDEESPLEDNKIDTPEYDENSEYNQSNDIENNNDQPELSEYPENSDLSSNYSSTPIEAYENGNIIKPHSRKIRRRRKSKQPQSVYENDKTPIEVNDENINNYPVEDQDVYNNYNPYNNNDVIKEDPHNGYGETNINESDKNQPELLDNPEYSNSSSKDSATLIDTDDDENVVKPRPRKIRRRRKSKQPQSAYGNDKTPIEVNDENINNYPVEEQDVYNNYNPYNYNDVIKDDPNNGYGEPNGNESDKNQPELLDNPEYSDLSSKDSATPIDTDNDENVVTPRPRKIRRRRKSKQPQSAYENDKTPIEVNDENINNYPVEEQDVYNNYNPYNYNDVIKEDPHNGYGETNGNESDKNQPELLDNPEYSDLSSKDSAAPIDTDDNENVVTPRPRKIRRRRKSKQPQSAYENDKTPIEVNDENINNYPVEEQDVNNNYIPFNNNDVLKEDPDNGYVETNDNESDKNQPELSDNPEYSDLSSKDSAAPIDTDDNENVVTPRPRKIRRRRKSKQPHSFNGNDKTPLETNDVSTKIIPTNVDEENSRVLNEEKSTEIPEIDPKNIQKKNKKKRHIRRIRAYVINKATNERIPINDQTYSTTDGLPDAINNKLDSLETDDSNVDDPDSNTDNDDYSSFLFKEYNSDQCKRDAYDRFKKVTSQDAKQIAYRSVLDTSEMRSNMLATIKNAIGNVKASRTLNDVDQSLRAVNYSLKVGLKQTVSDLVIKMIPLAKDFLKTAENLKELYQRGPQSTHKMLTNILDNESAVPESAKDILRLISPQFDVDELINNIFEKPCTAKSLKEKKVKAQRKLIDLSKHMDTAISNIDCFVLSAMSTVGIGADTLKLLKSGKVIMSDKHPRAKTLRDAVGIIKAGKKIRNNDDSFTPTLTPSDGTTESDEDDDDEDPDQVAQKNEEFLKTVPDLDDDIPIPKKVKNKRQSLGVIVVRPDRQIEYKEVTDTSQLKKFVGDQTKKYKSQSKNKHPKFLKLNSKQLIDAMVADVKKKAERNGMTKKEMVDEIIKNLNSS